MHLLFYSNIMLLIYHLMLPVLGFAYGPNMDNLVYVGMVGIMDPPRHGVREAIALLQQGGVSVKMLTGDAQETADSIGESGVGVCV